ncbi:glycosyltransferase family 39 protein [Mycobacterium vicinigordonae]|uniref:Glycosyltransferase family 39 protein n=2 Tax=Mycobacterium vicinigordonae TaxID=1719132 RepID=A0A7D6IQ41_9MYCO|nr:glycosyltransferase family 39 protein [Mycobacterium vicinigordonae]
MLTMLRWVRDGQLPLLGPLSSAPTVHHGAWFYWILAPGAFATDAHPVAAVATLAVIGVAGVAAAWWLGRTVAGPLAGHLTALLMSISPTSISSSTFVWNANIVVPGAALACAAAWHAWHTRRARWWLLSALGGLLMLNGHLLAALAIPPFAVLISADLLRRTRPERPRMLAPLAIAVVIIVVGFLPNLMYDLSHGFAQSHAIADFLGQPDDGRGPALPSRIVAISRRVLEWPVPGWPGALITAAALVFLAVFGQGIARLFGWWAAASTAWAALALAVVAPGLATPVAGLPTDQYHTWLDPILFAAVGISAARLWTALVPRTAAVVAIAACIALSVASLPPLKSPDGGWPRASDTATRIRAVTGTHPTAVTGVAKTGAALEFPLRRQGSPRADPSAAEFLVVTCDPLFFRVAVLPCGGQAEAATARDIGFPTARLMDRFADGPRRVVSIFANH